MKLSRLVFRFSSAALVLLAASCQKTTPLVEAEIDADDSQRDGELLSVEEFQNPPLQARPAALWTWMNGYTDSDQITYELEEMKAKGMRGAVIWDIGALTDPEKIIPSGPSFLGKESLATIHHAMDEAERLGLELGMVAASSWNSGGTWIEPENGSRKLNWSEIKIQGPSSYSELLALPKGVSGAVGEVAVMAVGAQGEVLDLTDQVDSDGRLEWQVPEGNWRVLRFVMQGTGELLNCPSPNSSGLVIDHLSKEANETHINHILDALMQGREDFGPLKMLMLDSYEVRSAVDWTPDFIARFKEHYNYDPKPWLPVLAGIEIGNEEEGSRFLHDYHKLVSDLLIEGHYAGSREFLNARGLKLLAEAGHGGHARVDPLKALGAADIPMGEFWNHRKNWVTKEAASAASIYGKTLVNSESFTGWQHWQDGPADYKRLLDIALCAGLNQVTFHTFAHQPAESGLPGYAYHAGEHFNVNNTWWPVAGPMLKDMSRACHLLQQGQFVADVAAYYGDNAPNLVPARRIAPTVEPRWTDDHCLHCGKLLPVDLRSLAFGYDYDFVNEEVILTRMSVEDGKLVLPHGMSYRVLVLPDRKTISLAALQRISELVEAGATIVGTKPERSNSLKGYPESDQQVQELANKIWGDCDGIDVKNHRYGKGQVFWNVPLTEVLESIGVEQDFVAENVDNSDRHIDFIHRATAKQDIYFVSNSSLQREVIDCRFRVGEGRVPSFWNAEDGSVTPCFQYEHKDGFTYLTVELAAASSIFVVFTQEEASEHVVSIKRWSTFAHAAWPATYPELEVLGLEGDVATARIWRSGYYAFTTSEGRNGQWVAEMADEVSAAQAIDGPWKLRFPTDRGAPEEITLPQLIDWTQHSDPAVKCFSGTATYHKEFTLPDDHDTGENPLMLDLGSVAEVAEVRVNGKEAGILWKLPFRVDVSNLVQPGVNTLEIEVTNVWNNRLVGDQNSATEDRITRTNMSSKFNPKSPLLPSGMLGPVSLIAPVQVNAEWQK